MLTSYLDCFLSRRLTVSQNRHQAYINCASFTETYVQYITNKPKRLQPSLRPTTEDGYLIINEYGPFDLPSRDNMRDLYAHQPAPTTKHDNTELPPHKTKSRVNLRLSNNSH